jgi:hypothetical protein
MSTGKLDFVFYLENCDLDVIVILFANVLSRYNRDIWVVLFSILALFDVNVTAKSRSSGIWIT